MSKKPKVTEKKSSIRVIEKNVVEETPETLEESVEQPTTQTTGNKAFLLREQPVENSPAEVNIARPNPESEENNVRPYDSATSNRESYLLQDNSHSAYQEMMRRPTGAISGQRANPTIDRPGAVQNIRTGNDNSGFQGDNNRSMGGESEREYREDGQFRVKRRDNSQL